MTHTSSRNSEGYPGDLLTQIKYSWTDDNQLIINIRACATEPTPVNITNNCLMNLAGHVKSLSTSFLKYVLFFLNDNFNIFHQFSIDKLKLLNEIMKFVN